MKLTDIMSLDRKYFGSLSSSTDYHVAEKALLAVSRGVLLDKPRQEFRCAS